MLGRIHTTMLFITSALFFSFLIPPYLSVGPRCPQIFMGFLILGRALIRCNVDVALETFVL